MLDSINGDVAVSEVIQPEVEQKKNKNVSYRGTDLERAPENDSFDGEKKNNTKKVIGITAGVLAAVALTLGAICYSKGKGADGVDKKFGERMKDGWRELWHKSEKKVNEVEEEIQDTVNEIKEEAQTKADEVKDELEQTTEEAKEKIEKKINTNKDEKMEIVEDEVQENAQEILTRTDEPLMEEIAEAEEKIEYQTPVIKLEPTDRTPEPGETLGKTVKLTIDQEKIDRETILLAIDRVWAPHFEKFTPEEKAEAKEILKQLLDGNVEAILKETQEGTKVICYYPEDAIKKLMEQQAMRMQQSGQVNFMSALYYETYLRNFKFEGSFNNYHSFEEMCKQMVKYDDELSEITQKDIIEQCNQYNNAATETFISSVEAIRKMLGSKTETFMDQGNLGDLNNPNNLLDLIKGFMDMFLK